MFKRGEGGPQNRTPYSIAAVLDFSPEGYFLKLFDLFRVYNSLTISDHPTAPS